MQIPTIDQLSADYNVARITIRQAINQLVVDGLLKSERGRGTFVISSGSVGPGRLLEEAEQLSQLGANGRIKVLQRNLDASVPSLLCRGHRTEGQYIHVRKINSQGGDVLFLMDFFVQAHLYYQYVDGKETEFSIQELLMSDFIETNVLVDTLIHTLFTDEVLSDLLGCEIASSSAELVRTFYGRDGTVAAASSTIYQPGLFRYKSTQTARDYFRSRFPSNAAFLKKR